MSELEPIRIDGNSLQRSFHGAVFFDRDGVLVDGVMGEAGPRPPWALDEIHFGKTVFQAISDVHDAGLYAVVITNQPDVARGQLPLDTCLEIANHIVNELDIDVCYICPHDSADNCPCRKPAPGMVEQALTELSVTRAQAALIGDRWVDIACANRAHIPGILYSQIDALSPTSAGNPPDELDVAFTSDSLEGCVDFAGRCCNG